MTTAGRIVREVRGMLSLTTPRPSPEFYHTARAGQYQAEQPFGISE